MEALNVPISMLKRGLSPDETEDIVSSKIKNIFTGINLERARETKLNSRKQEVMKCVSYSIRDDGCMDDRRCSPKVWQDLGIIPAPVKEKQYQIPQREAEIHGQQYIDFVNETQQTAKSMLGGFLRRVNVQELPDVELCYVIDNATRFIVQRYMQDGADQRQAPIENPKRVIQYCLKIAICQIVSLMRREQPFDILTDADYIEWKSCLGVIASFAALSIVLDLFDDRNFIIPENIVD